MLIEIGGKGYVTIGAVKTAATAGKINLGTAEEKRVTRLLNYLLNGGTRIMIDSWALNPLTLGARYGSFARQIFQGSRP